MIESIICVLILKSSPIDSRLKQSELKRSLCDSQCEKDN